ncbi:MAG: hypothetical protein K9M10_01810 [Candidatus Pacebacteria bacterium]|nr:hypothetical protein [Candidatus Paceibacterota bacterium]MCF7857199.1 hypothetical protein [Candidatus Paceibacterota bacterium]
MIFFPKKKQYRPYVTIEKLVGETPLISLEKLRKNLSIPSNVPLAYAGRLDPMASGKLLILMGDECKVQEKYHSFDKEYQVEILLGTSSDTGDVLGLLSSCEQKFVREKDVCEILDSTTGTIDLPYPHFSSKTVRGKPLHTWTLEGRLSEIEIPIKTSMLHKLTLDGIRKISKEEILETVRKKIETIPAVTDERKALGADFRRDAVRKSWDTFASRNELSFQILSFTCIASSGTYMRSLAGLIAKELGTCGLAYSIHRTKIGSYIPIFKDIGFWLRTF